MQVLDPDNGGTTVARRSANTEVAMSRAAQEVQAAMIIAKKFPRNEQQARDRIKEACKSLRLAEDSQYEYAKGGTEIVGPSIRLLEVVAQRWGNCEGGTIELDRSDGKSTMMSYAVDLETNHREIRIFDVEHVRDTKKGSFRITDGREIYEMGANLGSRRRRACYQAVIPTEVVDEAVEECNKTLRGESKQPLAERIAWIVGAFAEYFSVTPEMIAAKMGCKIEAISYLKLAKLRRIYNSLRDGIADVGDFFDVPPTDLKAGKAGFGFKKEQPAAGQGAAAASTPQAAGAATAQAGQPTGESSAEPSADEQAAIRQREQQEGAQAAQGGTAAGTATSQPAAAAEPSAGQPGAQGGGNPGPGQPPAALSREQLLAEISALEDKRKMRAADRSGLWRQFCGNARPEEAPIDALQKLHGHLKILASGSLV